MYEYGIPNTTACHPIYSYSYEYSCEYSSIWKDLLIQWTPGPILLFLKTLHLLWLYWLWWSIFEWGFMQHQQCRTMPNNAQHAQHCQYCPTLPNIAQQWTFNSNPTNEVSALHHQSLAMPRKKDQFRFFVELVLGSTRPKATIFDTPIFSISLNNIANTASTKEQKVDLDGARTRNLQFRRLKLCHWATRPYDHWMHNKSIQSILLQVLQNSRSITFGIIYFCCPPTKECYVNELQEI